MSDIVNLDELRNARDNNQTDSFTLALDSVVSNHMLHSKHALFAATLLEDTERFFESVEKRNDFVKFVSNDDNKLLLKTILESQSAFRYLLKDRPDSGNLYATHCIAENGVAGFDPKEELYPRPMIYIELGSAPHFIRISALTSTFDTTVDPHAARFDRGGVYLKVPRVTRFTTPPMKEAIHPANVNKIIENFEQFAYAHQGEIEHLTTDDGESYSTLLVRGTNAVIEFKITVSNTGYEFETKEN